MKKIAVPLFHLFVLFSSAALAEPDSDWKLDVGLRWFKHAAGAPNEIGPNRVFDRWESINQD